jgi:hypothetical protein
MCPTASIGSYRFEPTAIVPAYRKRWKRGQAATFVGGTPMHWLSKRNKAKSLPGLRTRYPEAFG